MAKLRRAVVKEEYVAITKNDSVALILNQLIFWSKRTKDCKKYIQEEQDRASKGKNTLKYGWIYKSYSELKYELMTANSEKTIGRHLSKLIELGFIDRKKNEKYKYDKKYIYRINLLNIVSALHEHGYEMLDYKFDFQNVASEKSNDIPEGPNVPSMRYGDVAIAKTIPESTTKNINITTGNVVLDLEKLNINGIINAFREVTTRYPNERDMTILNEVLKVAVDVEPEQKIKTITETVRRIGIQFKKRTPDDRINSFNYFKKAILNEFKVLEQRSKGGELKIESTGKTKKSTDEYDLERLYTNK